MEKIWAYIPTSPQFRELSWAAPFHRSPESTPASVTHVAYLAPISM